MFDVIGSIVILLCRCYLPNDEGPGPPNIFFLEPPLVSSEYKCFISTCWISVLDYRTTS